MAEQKKSVPNSWEQIEIEKILHPLENGNSIQQGWSPRCENFPSLDERHWGVLKTTAIQIGEFLPEYNKQLPEALDPRPQIEVKLGDILMTCAGPRSRCGVTCLVKTNRNKLMMSGKMYRFRTNPERVLPKYLEFFLRTQEAQFSIDKMKTGISDSGLNLTHDRFKNLVIPLAPTNEQHRIVAKIEELFSEIDKGVESLEKAKAQLRIYRQSLLKNAFEGKLTAQWRLDNPDKVVPAEQLLEQIKQAREERYQQQLEEWEGAIDRWKMDGHSEKKPTKPSQYSSLNLLNGDQLSALPELPSYWSWILLGDVSDISGGLTKNSKRNNSSITKPYLRVANVYANELRLNEVHEIGMNENEIERVLLVKDDLLIVEGNGSIEHIGRVAKWDGSIKDCVHQNHLIKARILKKISNPDFTMYFLLSKIGRDLIIQEASSTSGLHTLNLSKVANLKVPVCSLPESFEVVRLLEEKLSRIDRIKISIEREIQRSSALRQSILKKAFSGKLVPQDPTDEPASQLLERIKTEKANSQTKTTPKTRKPKPIPAPTENGKLLDTPQQLNLLPSP